MRSFFTQLGAVAVLATSVATTQAQSVPVMDGMVDAIYGSALSVQNTGTQFGDSDLGDLIATADSTSASQPGGGSEIDGVYAVIANGRLYVTVTGNLERNFNKLEVLVDSVSGGSNVLNGASLPDRVDGFCCNNNAPGDGALQRMNGLTFDADFSADYYLTFTHGVEQVGPITTGSDRETKFWAISAHYADLTQGTSGAVVSAGMQLGPQGLPVALRFPFNSDFDSDADADGADFLIWQRNVGATTGATRATGDATGDGAVTGDDLAQWNGEFGVTRSLGDLPYAPNDTPPRTTALIGPELPGLGQGELIDKNYVAANGSDGMGGLIAKELEFALAEDSMDPATLDRNRRNMENTVGLQMAINNSNAVGVEGKQAAPWDTAGNPQDVVTGIEFSIPLSQLGSPTGDIKLTIFVNNDGHNYASNQFAGVGILDGNLGGNGFGGFTGDLSGVNLATLAGNQYVTVVQATASGAVPEPASGALMAFAALALSARRRRLRSPAVNPIA